MLSDRAKCRVGLYRAGAVTIVQSLPCGVVDHHHSDFDLVFLYVDVGPKALYVEFFIGKVPLDPFEFPQA